MAYPVEIWFLIVMAIFGKNRNKHLLAGRMSLQQLSPNTRKVWGLLFFFYLFSRSTCVLASIFGKSAVAWGSPSALPQSMGWDAGGGGWGEGVVQVGVFLRVGYSVAFVEQGGVSVVASVG